VLLKEEYAASIMKFCTNATAQGLGNKFLDDLRHAHVLLHIVDVSGRTNEKGEETRGYDPLRDVDWLQDEIHRFSSSSVFVLNECYRAAGYSITYGLNGHLSLEDTLQQVSAYP
jgi:hypothetical protein